jgi:prevent-host-death family protein
MKTVAVAELKAALSKYLSAVKAGEEVLVTDRGKPIAKMIPLAPGDIDVPDQLLTLERAGLAVIGRKRLPKDFWTLARPRVAGHEAVQAVIDEREHER